MVDSSVDVQAGVVTIFTRMPNPEQAVALSSAVLKQVSRHVDNLGAQLGTQRLAVTRNSADEARADLKEARRALVELQILAGDIDPAQRIAATYAQIADIETQIYDLRAQIDRSVVSGNADSYEIDRKRELIQKLQEQAEQSRQSLVDRDDGRTSPNELLMEFELAAQNVIIAEETLSSALSAWSRAQVEVALERSVTQVVVPALAPTEPTYPRILVTLFITAVIGAAVFFTLRMILLDPE
jgi:capsule polysaccharide export protein KpsE/RkpR